MKPGMFLLSKVSVAIVDKLPVISFSALLSIFLFEENSAQIWALGSAYKFVPTHAINAVLNVTTVEMYEQGLEMTQDYAKVLSSKEENRTLPKPPRVTPLRKRLWFKWKTHYTKLVSLSFLSSLNSYL